MSGRSNFTTHRRSKEDSFVVADSDEEIDNSFKGNSTTANPRVIGDSDSDSDSDGDDSKNVDLTADSAVKESGSESVDSEEEDLQFMNTSQKVSIIEHSSESDSDDSSEEDKKPVNRLKRRSIYDNPVSVNTPKSESTPINAHFRKKARKAVVSSDSDSEDVSVNRVKSSGKIRKSLLVYAKDEEMSEEMDSEPVNIQKEKNKSLLESSDESSSSNCQELLRSSDSVHEENENSLHDRSKILEQTSTNDENTSKAKSLLSENDSFLEEKSISKDEDMHDKSVSEISEPSPSNNINKSKAHKSPFVEKKLSTKNNVIDLTINDPRHDHSIKEEDKEVKSIQNDQKDDDSDIIICSSTSTSENEMDKEVIDLAKKEIGVGNIDPIEAQKKEHLLLNIDHTQKQLDKLNKCASSMDINQLPDKGAKVHQLIKQQEEKLMSLKEKLAKLSRKSISSTPARITTPKIKEESKVKPFIQKSLISPLDEDKMSVKRLSCKMNNNVKKGVNANNDPKFSNQFNEFDIHEIPKVPLTSFDAGELGKKALETLNKQQSMTHKRLEQLHGSLTTRPTEDKQEKDPSGLKIPLMAHQLHALAWMKWREKQKPKGGILADDMGLGKTLTMISLVLGTVNDERERDSDESSSSDDGWMSRKKHKRYYGGTLVICPASLIKQWEAEVKNRCKRGLLSVLVFHGNNRSMEDRKLSKYNIVVTTYQIIVREAGSQTGMYRMEWNRIILDEAHYIRNHKSKACIAVCGLTAKHRWALTGTPIQNKEMDLYAILMFLKCSPFDDLQVWKRWVDNKNDAGKQRLVTIMKTIMLRRTKQELQAKGSLQSLPDKNLELIEIELDHNENLAYQKILLFSQNLFAQFLSQRAEKQHMRDLYGGKYDRPSYASNQGSKTQFTKAQKVLLDHHSSIEAHEILVLLLRLRQMCCHPALIHSMLDKHDTEVNGLEEDEDTNAELINKLHNMSINQEEEGIEEHVANYKIDERVASNLLTKKNPVFDNDRRSSKVRIIIKTIEEILEKGDKLIVVSQWTSFLEIVAKNLEDVEDAKYAMFTGKVAVKNRQAVVDQFNDPREDTNILLLSLTAGGVGLNLVGANHLLLIDIHWNPQLESQAQDRIYRFGQTKSVHIYKFMCKDTIEERVKNLQDKKLDIANHVLTGTRSVSSKLTIEDLKLLFS